MGFQIMWNHFVHGKDLAFTQRVSQWDLKFIWIPKVYMDPSTVLRQGGREGKARKWGITIGSIPGKVMVNERW